MKLRVAVFSVSALLLTNPLSAQSTVDFQDVTSGQCAGAGLSVVSRGFSFVGNPGDGGLFICDAGVIQNNTSSALINANQRSILTMSRVGGGTFSLNSFFAGGRTADFAPGSPVTSYSVATGIDILGNLLGGGTVSTSVTLGSVAPYSWSQFFLTSQFSNLTSIRFTAQGDGSNPEFLIDDIVVDSQSVVPEPESVALVASGLFGLGVVARRRRTS